MISDFNISSLRGFFNYSFLHGEAMFSTDLETVLHVLSQITMYGTPKQSSID